MYQMSMPSMGFRDDQNKIDLQIHQQCVVHHKHFFHFLLKEFSLNCGIHLYIFELLYQLTQLMLCHSVNGILPLLIPEFDLLY